MAKKLTKLQRAQREDHRRLTWPYKTKVTHTCKRCKKDFPAQYPEHYICEQCSKILRSR